jgi:branched-chain amino acid transport system permease protein
MEQFLTAVFAGTASGSIYALVALGLVLVWRGAGVINFAQMGQAMFSTYVASTLIMNGYSYWVAFFVALAVGTTLGTAVDLLVMRPLSGNRSSAMVF